MSESTYTPREGSIADRAIQELANGPRWTGGLAEALEVETSPLGASLKTAVEYGAVGRMASASGRLVMYYLPDDEQAARELFAQKVDEPPQVSTASPPPAAPPKAKAPRTAIVKAPAPAAARSTSPAPIVPIPPPGAGQDIAITQDGAAVVIEGDRVVQRFSPAQTRSLFHVMTRLAG